MSPPSSSADEPLHPAPLAYASPLTVPARPGILVAVGFVSLIVAVIAFVVNALAVVGSFGLYKLILPPPPPRVLTPLVPAVPLTPYHSDLLPPAGLPAAGRAAVLAAVNAVAPLTADRRAMLDRILAEASLAAFGGTVPADAAAARAALSSVGQNPAGPDGPGPLASQYLVTAAGRITVDNATATFRPADGSAVTTVAGNFVTTAGHRAFTEAVDRLKRESHGLFNALQAAGVADHMRAMAPTGARWATPILRDAHSPGPDAGGTVELDLIGGGQLWVLTTGYVLPKSYSPPPLDPHTGVPIPTAPPPPVRPRRMLPVDVSLIIGSAVEYALSGLLAVLPFAAGLRLLTDRADGPRLRGLYAVPKLFLAVVNLARFVQVARQMVDGGFGREILWYRPVFALCVQSAYPIALVITFGSYTKIAYYRQRRWDGSLIPGPWMAAAARLSPDRWTRRIAAIAFALGLLVLAADGYWLALAHGRPAVPLVHVRPDAADRPGAGRLRNRRRGPPRPAGRRRIAAAPRRRPLRPRRRSGPRPAGR